MSKAIQFFTWQDVARQMAGRPLALFGAGNIASKTRRKLKDVDMVAIFDNASDHWGEEELGVVISNPEDWADFPNRPYILITTTSVREVSEQLISMGLSSGTDFAVSPVLNDLRIIDELESIERRLMFTSGSPPVDASAHGGGVYEMEVQGDSWAHIKKISGNCYGITEFNGNYVTVDTERGIVEFDSDYKIVRSRKLPHGARAHGVCYDPNRRLFFMTCSYLDAVLVLDEDFKQLAEIQISHKRNRYGSPSHHCNDCCVWEDSLFVSMFSLNGNWKQDVFDGGVLEIDIETHEIIGPAATGLWMPHNVTFINGGFTLLDSLPGYLRANNLQVIGTFPAFTRGLAHDGMFHYIGQSRNRNYSRNLGRSRSISIDAGVIVFDEYTKVSRFLQLPPKVSEIHSIKVIS
ncbi:MAG: DUF4915 domain-containing protein [Verrucomicrobia bacterium]|nr:DUF4915 domain-containing protein [Verrucomicrobiota bacterium]